VRTETKMLTIKDTSNAPEISGACNWKVVAMITQRAINPATAAAADA
jgi:hypothetical protein